MARIRATDRFDRETATANPHTPDQAFALFDELVDASAAEREARLREIARDQPELAREVRELCDAHSQAGDFLDQPAMLQAPTLARDAVDAAPGATTLRPGGRIGAWELVRPLGTGGMGEVWEVLRADGQFQQQAALKLLKRGLDSDVVLRRFRVERELLARLRHPAIAHLYDGGVAPDGRPYYVMELVAGLPITAACIAQKLPVEARLRALSTVCEAVDTAHRSLVVHRDLKPSNVLLTATGEVKLLDFGIAKLLGDDDLAGNATQRWERLLTPAYAAPEQILGEPVTTATDVYALGVVLFELLTGRLPHRRRAANPVQLADEMTRETVERPSTAVRRQEAEDVTELLVADERERRAKRLRGDLDSIVLRALAREPERRYPSAAALAADLRRHLEGRPIEARGDSLGYRASKFVRRNRVAVAAAGLVAAALVAGSAVALWQAREARAAAVLAEEEATRARREATRSDRIAEFLKSMILEANPTARGSAEPPSLLDVVHAGAARIEDGLADEPELRTRLGIFFGDLFLVLGERAEAKRLIERAFAVASESPGVEPRTVAEVHGSLAHLRYEERDLAEAERLYREALRRAEEVLVANPDDASALRLEATLRSLLANTLHDQGRFDEAIDATKQVLSSAESLYGGEHREVVITLTNLGMMLNAAGRFEEAEPHLRRSLELHRRLFGENDAGVYYVGTALGDALVTRGALAEALTSYESALAAVQAAFGPADVRVAGAILNFAEAWLAKGELERAEATAKEALDLARRRGDDRVLGLAYQLLGEITMATGKPAEARRVFEAGVGVARRHFGDDHQLPIDLAIRAAHARARAGEATAVVAELEALVRRQRQVAPGIAVVTALRAQGETLLAAGRRTDGIARLREAVELATAELGAERLATAQAELQLGLALGSGADEAERAEGRRRLTASLATLERLGHGWTSDAARARALLDL